MAIRNNAPREDFDDSAAISEPWDASGKPKMLIRIDGLRQMASGENLFELTVDEVRQIDWFAAGLSMGFGPNGMPDELADKLADVLWDHDIRELLAQRIKRA